MLEAGGGGDLRPENRVAFHLLIFGIGQGGGLGEDRIGNTDLPHVMKQAREAHLSDECRGERQFRGIRTHSCDTVWQWLRV